MVETIGPDRDNAKLTVLRLSECVQLTSSIKWAFVHDEDRCGTLFHDLDSDIPEPVPNLAEVAEDEVGGGQPAEQASAGAERVMQRAGLADARRTPDAGRSTGLVQLVGEAASELREVNRIGIKGTERKFAIGAVDEDGCRNVGVLGPLVEGRESGEFDRGMLLLDPDGDTWMGAGPGGKLVAFIDVNRGEFGGIAAGGRNALRDRLDAIGGLIADEGLGGDADIAAATGEHALNSVIEDLDGDCLRLGGLGPDLLFPLGVARILCLALEDDVAPGEVIGRTLATRPMDAGVLSSGGNRF